MVESPYVRSSLAATRARIPDSAVELECRLDRLEEILALAGPSLPPTACYDLLALWAWLQRLRPDLRRPAAEPAICGEQVGGQNQAGHIGHDGAFSL